MRERSPHRFDVVEFDHAGNLCVIDPALAWEVDPTRLASRARNTPYAARKVTGRVRPARARMPASSARCGGERNTAR